jgi:hypothetical protein
MQFENRRHPRRRGWQAGWLAIAAIIAAASCNQRGTQASDKGDTQTPKITDVLTTHTGSQLIFQYRTQSSTEDCKAQAAEMPKIWNQLMKPYARNPNVQSVILFPADPSGVSVSFEFGKTTSGQWAAMAPCPISIPTE